MCVLPNEVFTTSNSTTEINNSNDKDKSKEINVRKGPQILRGGAVKKSIEYARRKKGATKQLGVRYKGGRSLFKRLNIPRQC